MKKFHKKLIPYLFISPFFIGYAIFFAYPVFQSLKLTDSSSKVSLVENTSQPEFTDVMIEELELSVRAYNCLNGQIFTLLKIY